MECYRCGYCGQPTTEDGWPLALWQIAVMNPFVDWNNPTDQRYGECCRRDQEQQYITVTREMALDACCPEMEGALWPW